MKTLTNLDLEIVTGGSYPLGSIDKPGSSSGSNDQLLSALQGIQSSLKDLGEGNNNQGLFGGSNGLLFAALMMSQHNNTVVYQGGGGYCGGGPCINNNYYGGGGWGGGRRGHGYKVKWW